MVYRLYVEKKKGFDVEAQGLLSDIKQSLNIESLKGIRVLNRYDIAGIHRDTFNLAKFTVFAEPAVDKIYEEEIDSDMGKTPYFAVELLPGQYDQRADSAAVCITLLKPETNPSVKFARVIVLEGNLKEAEIEEIKAYVVNPVDSRLADIDKPESLEMTLEKPEKVKVLEGFVHMDEKELETLIKEMGLAMSLADLKHIHTYFKDEEKRNPTLTEILVIDTYWSDHCRHTTFNTELTDIDFDESDYGQMVKNAFNEYMAMRKDVYKDEEKPVTLMDMACIGAKYLKKQGKASKIDESEEINACSIKVTADIDGKEEDWLVMFKNETHNHPTEIEPYGGAATCLGGAIRDPLSGRVYVYQAMRVTGAADPRTPIQDTLEGKLPQKKITREAAAGYSGYGNQIGLATGQVSEIYHPDYVAKRMEVGAVVGAAPAKNVVRRKPSPSDAVILVGGRTGRDGCGGATGSSKEHDIESISSCGAEVQKGNPPVERNIQRLFRREEVSTLIKRCNDFGAGGVSVAIGELADGLDIDLDKVSKKYEGLDGTELAISESQERMAVVVAAENQEAFMTYAAEENLEAAKVARVTDTNRVRMYWQGEKILDLSREFLNTNGAKQYAQVKVVKEKIAGEDKSGLDAVDLDSVVAPPEIYGQSIKSMADLDRVFNDLNTASQKGMVDRFDSTIGAATVLMPLGGKYQLSPSVGMAAKLPVIKGETDTVTLMAYGFDPYLAGTFPYYGAMYAVIDSVAKLAAMGGDYKEAYLSFQEYFEKLTDKMSWGRPMSALLGALKVQKELGIPAIGGKDSMSGTFMNISVPPSLLSFAIVPASAKKVVSGELKKRDSQIVSIDLRSHPEREFSFEAFRKAMEKIHKLAEEEKILSAHTVGRGGAFVTLVKMAAGNKIGFEVKGFSPKKWLEPDYGNMILELPASLNVEKEFKDISELEGLEVKILGKTDSGNKLVLGDEEGRDRFEASLDHMIEKWSKPLESTFPTDVENYEGENCSQVEKIDFPVRSAVKPAKYLEKDEKPYVVIPVFPGTNCEADSARAFEKAGAETSVYIIKNRTSEELKTSIEELAREIDKAHMIMIPGGFSGGDEPDGSAKFINAVFRNPKISSAVEGLINERKGLIIGICNGFQALIKLGLVPFGKIMPQTEDSPTLTYNRIGRHVSTMVRTGVASVKSPWFADINVGDVFTIPVSHGEGRFICKSDLFKKLAEEGQIATQYVDYEGNPSMDIQFNPNYSFGAVEAITSPDGRIIGKMGHAERIGDNLYKNIDGDKDMKLFEAAVNYFKK